MSGSPRLSMVPMLLSALLILTVLGALPLAIAAHSGGTETPLPKPVKQKTNPVDGAEMVWVPAGDFLMGSTEDDVD